MTFVNLANLKRQHALDSLHVHNDGYLFHGLRCQHLTPSHARLMPVPAPNCFMALGASTLTSQHLKAPPRKVLM